MSQTVIGLDIGHYSIKVLKLEVNYREFSAAGFDEQRLGVLPTRDEVAQALYDSRASDVDPSAEDAEPLYSEQELEDAIHNAEDDAVSNALFELQARGAIEPESTIAVALPPDLVMSTRMAFPFKERRQLQAIIPAQFEEKVPLAVEELMIDHHVIGSSTRDPGMFDISVSATKRSDLDVYLGLWQDATIDPHFILMGDASMLHLATHLLPDATEPYAIVDIGHRFSRVACIEPGLGEDMPPVLGFERSIQTAGHNITMALCEALSVSYSEAERYKHQDGYIAVETIATGIEQVKSSDAIKKALKPLIRNLRSTLHAHFISRRDPIQRIYLTGGSSRLTNLNAFLADQLKLPVEPLPMASEMLMALPGRDGKSHILSQALALALRDTLPSDSISEINFRQGAFAHTRSRSWIREQIPGIVVLGICLLLALLSLFGSRYFAIQKQLDATTQALEIATEDLFGEATTNVVNIKKKLSSDDGEPKLIPRYSAYEYFYEVQSRLPEGLKVDLYRLDVDIYRQLIKIEGNTESAASVDQIVESLEGFQCFKGNVQKGNVDSVGEEVKFSLNIATDCGSSKKEKK